MKTSMGCVGVSKETIVNIEINLLLYLQQYICVYIGILGYKQLWVHAYTYSLCYMIV